MMRMISIFLLLLSFNVLSDNNDKYKNFELILNSEMLEYHVRTGKKSVPEEVINLVNANYQTSDIKSSNFYSFVNYSEDKYFLMGTFPSSENKYTQCTIKSESCDITFLLHIDMGNKKVDRLDDSQFYELSVNGLIATGGLEAYNVFGCQLRAPLQTGDIDLDGVDDVFVFGGIGQFGSDEGGKTIKTTLTIFDGMTNKKVFTSALSYENFIVNDFGENKTEFQSIGWADLSSTGQVKYVGTKQGVRTFTKLFFEDYDKNGLLDIITWEKSYLSRVKSESTKGYKLASSVFKRFEEFDKTFVERSVSEKQVNEWLELSKFSWENGFPSKNLCMPNAPLIDSYEGAELNISE